MCPASGWSLSDDERTRGQPPWRPTVRFSASRSWRIGMGRCRPSADMRGPTALSKRRTAKSPDILHQRGTMGGGRARTQTAPSSAAGQPLAVAQQMLGGGQLFDYPHIRRNPAGLRLVRHLHPMQEPEDLPLRRVTPPVSGSWRMPSSIGGTACARETRHPGGDVPAWDPPSAVH
jgi:hypothetical protein